MEVKALIEVDDRAPLARIQDAVAIAIEKDLGYYQDKLHPKLFLVHECNRNEFMLDWYAAQETLSDVKTAGGCKERTSMSHAIELSSDQKNRDTTIERNKELVANSTGHLAPVNGTEKFATWGSSHFTAAGKAACAECKSPFDNISKDGKLCLTTIQGKDKYLADLLTSGWRWFIWREWVLDVWPNIGSFIQDSLNAGNQIGKSKTELQCLYDFYMRFRSGAPKESAIKSIYAQNPNAKRFWSQSLTSL